MEDDRAKLRVRSQHQLHARARGMSAAPVRSCRLERVGEAGWALKRSSERRFHHGLETNAMGSLGRNGRDKTKIGYPDFNSEA